MSAIVGMLLRLARIILLNDDYLNSMEQWEEIADGAPQLSDDDFLQLFLAKLDRTVATGGPPAPPYTREAEPVGHEASSRAVRQERRTSSSTTWSLNRNRDAPSQTWMEHGAQRLARGVERLEYKWRRITRRWPNH